MVCYGKWTLVMYPPGENSIYFQDWVALTIFKLYKFTFRRHQI